MNCLLDSHVLIWWLSGHKALSKEAKLAIADSKNSLFISAASLWELRIKQIKKDWEGAVNIQAQLKKWQINVLPIDAQCALEAPKLRLPHGDPFDRMILYQSILYNLMLLTADKVFLKQKEYKIAIIRAK